MNQIINIDLNKNIDNSKVSDTVYKIPSKKFFSKRLFSVQFFLSLFAVLIITSLFIYYKFSLNHKESFSDLLIHNYSITKLYSNHNDISVNKENTLAPDSIIGIIEIPILHISYPIFNELDDELLKTSPCRFYGHFPSETSLSSTSYNLCIAGHNYDNQAFFSNIKHLNVGDEICLYDTFDNQYIYSVIKNYEVKSDDLSPVYDTITNSFELTLVTCNNFNGNRIIIKAKRGCPEIGALFLYIIFF